MKPAIPDISTSDLPAAVIDIARQASDRILEIYETDFTVEKKADRSPLTAADMAAHHTICDGLSGLTPDLPILSEESADIPYATRKSWSRYWLVDPLDGTREFVKKNGEFTVNIALIQGHTPVLGVVYVPVSGLCYFASRGRGAYKQDPAHRVQRIHVKTTSPGKFVMAGSRSHGNEQQTRFIEVLGKGTELIAIGSSMKFCLVAEGKVDIYPRFGPTSEWDTAAAHCIVDEAGGMVTDIGLNPLGYNKKESLLNPGFLVIADRHFNWQQYLKCVNNI
ncbi:MAG: 3'(2'),5'-bisphosphate nucleotidase CysQ [Gammaproteobacteria bacterium]